MEIPLLANVLLVIGGLAIAGSVIGETPHTSPTLKRLFLKKNWWVVWVPSNEVFRFPALPKADRG